MRVRDYSLWSRTSSFLNLSLYFWALTASIMNDITHTCNLGFKTRGCWFEDRSWWQKGHIFKSSTISYMPIRAKLPTNGYRMADHEIDFRVLLKEGSEVSKMLITGSKNRLISSQRSVPLCNFIAQEIFSRVTVSREWWFRNLFSLTSPERSFTNFLDMYWGQFRIGCLDQNYEIEGFKLKSFNFKISGLYQLWNWGL